MHHHDHRPARSPILDPRVGLSLALVLFGCVSGQPPSGSGTTSDAGTGSNATEDPSGSSGGVGSSGGGADDSTGDPSGRHHPVGFADAAMHGPALKLQAEDCRGCHGTDLAGVGAVPSCDSCHQEGWREDCVYCHGGTADQTGAPPRDLDETTDVSLLTFIAHPKHVIEQNHPAYDCDQCHVKPTDVLSMNHIFDTTHGASELDFTAGLSPAGVWDGSSTCGSLYCHGNGRQDNGSYMHDQPTPSCGGCHAYPGTEQPNIQALSGRHAKHSGEGVACRDCHVDTDAGGNIATATLHVNGSPEIAFSENAPNITWNAASKSCTGSCHGTEGENHNHQSDEDWNSN